MIKAVCFDFYDVIHVDPFQKWLSELGLKREGPLDEISRQYDRGLIAHEELLAELGRMSGQDPQSIQETFIASRKFDEDVIMLIQSLTPSYSIGLISNSGGPGIRRLLQSRNLEPIFDEIIVSGEVGHIKPEKEIFDLALERLDVQPAETVFIDDNPLNIEAAISYGIHGIIFTSIAQLFDDLTSLGVLVS